MKRKTWITVLVVLLVAALLAACGGNKSGGSSGSGQSSGSQPTASSGSSGGGASGGGTSGGGSGAPANQKEMTIRVAHNLPETQTVGKVMVMFKEEVEKRTAETSVKLKIDLYPAGQLFNDSTMVDALLSNSLEMGVINPDTWAGGVPALKAISMPFAFDSFAHKNKAEDGEFGQLIAQVMNENGLQFVSWTEYGTMTYFFKNKTVAKPEDLRGVRIRSFGQTSAETAQAFGASPTVISSSEMYQALERGTIDGVHTGVSSIVERKLYEVLTDMTGGPNFRITFLTQILAASPKFWNELPDDTRAAIIEAAKVANDWGRQDAEQNDSEYTKQVQELGMKLTEVSPEDGQRFREKVQPVYDNYVSAAGEIGQKILDAIDAARK